MTMDRVRKTNTMIVLILGGICGFFSMTAELYAVPTSYSVNGKRVPIDSSLFLTLQDHLINLNADQQPVDEVLRLVSQQSDYQVQWHGNADQMKNLTLNVNNAPFWSVLMAICWPNQWGFTVYPQETNHPIEVNASSTYPLRSYQVNGPLLVTWNGPAQKEIFDYSFEPPKLKKIKTHKLNFYNDLNSHIKIEKSKLDLKFNLTLENGKKQVIKADREFLGSLGQRSWDFDPLPKLAGQPATLNFNMPVWAPTRRQDLSLPLKEEQTKQIGEVLVEIVSLKERDKELLATFRLKTDEAALAGDQEEYSRLMAKFENEKTSPTKADMTQIKILKGGGRILALDKVFLLGASENNIKGTITKADGTNGPVVGYTYDVIFQVPDDFEPQKLTLIWVERYRPLDIPFTLNNISL